MISTEAKTCPVCGKNSGSYGADLRSLKIHIQRVAENEIFHKSFNPEVPAPHWEHLKIIKQKK